MREPKDIIIRGRTLESILKEHRESYLHKVNKFENILDLRGADLSFANLSNAYLYKAQLESANLYSANLSGANLSFSNLSHAYLRKAQLESAKLRSANLRGADLSSADLLGADLVYSNMTFSTLDCANLSSASLCSASLCNSFMGRVNLKSADLSFANLSRVSYFDCANIEGAILTGANLYDIEGEIIKLREGQVLTEDLIGYKKCLNYPGIGGAVIVTLKIPKGAIVFSINGRKCRTNKAKVIAIDGGDRAYSIYNGASYYVGDKITINNFDCRYNVGCSTGIHFFKSRKEAEEYKI